MMDDGYSCEACIPVYIRVFNIVSDFFAKLPKDEATMCLGFLLCFFGTATTTTTATAL